MSTGGEEVKPDHFQKGISCATLGMVEFYGPPIVTSEKKTGVYI